MRNDNNNLKLVYILVLALILGVSGCATSYNKSDVHTVSSPPTNLGLRAVKKVALLPVEVTSDANGCALGLDLYSALSSAYRSELGVEVLASEELERVSQGTSSDAANALAKKVGADAALFSTLQQCEDRSGSRIGSDSPAEVALSFVLVDTTTQSEIWRGGFKSNEAPLSDNILKLDEKIKNLHFHSAGELVQQGLRSSAHDLENSRRKQFLVTSGR